MLSAIRKSAVDGGVELLEFDTFWQPKRFLHAVQKHMPSRHHRLLLEGGTATIKSDYVGSDQQLLCYTPHNARLPRQPIPVIGVRYYLRTRAEV